MTDLDVDPFVARSLSIVGSTPPTTERETRTWLVEPFLEALGWPLREEECRIDRTLEDVRLEDVRLEYVLAVDSVPAVLVAVEPCPDSLDESRATALLETMAWTGVDRAIYTNGREYLLFAGTTGAEHRSCRLPSLPDHEPSLKHYSREDARQRLERGSRDSVARQLAVERSTVADAVVDQLTAVSGDRRHAGEFESAAGRFLDRLVVSFADEDRAEVVDRGGISLEYTGPSLSNDGLDQTDDDRTENGATETQTAESDSSTDTETISSETEPTDDDQPNPDDDGSEYVVRFFTDRGSIGAIGHSSASQALVQAAEYCLDRGLAGVSVPWSPSNGDLETVLNDEPIRADGSPMGSPRQLSNGYYLETGGDVDRQASRVEALASRAGLRAMLTGDWGE